MRAIQHVFGAIAAAFGSTGGTSRRPAPVRNRARLALESLDPRLAPSSLLDLGFTDPTVVTTQLDGLDGAGGGIFGPPLSVPAAQAPRLTNFVGVEIVGGLYRFSGDVIDAAPGGLTVTFGGEPDSLQNVTVTTDANGHFDKVMSVKTDGSDNGTASAQTVNAAGLGSNVALTIIHPG